MTPMHGLAASLIVAGASFIGAIGGFGGGIFAMSILILFLDLRLAAVSFALAALVSCLQLTWTMRHELPIKASLPIVGGRVVGVAIGVQLLNVPGLDLYAKTLLTLVITGLALKELIWPDREQANLPEEIRIPLPTGVSLGALSGILNGWINMGGPPIILYTYRTFEGRAARRLLITTFLMTFPVQLGICWYKGMFNRAVFTLFGWMVPGVIIGTLAGHLLQKRIKREVFIRVVWILLLVLGIILGINTIMGSRKVSRDMEQATVQVSSGSAATRPADHRARRPGHLCETADGLPPGNRQNQ